LSGEPEQGGLASDDVRADGEVLPLRRLIEGAAVRNSSDPDSGVLVVIVVLQLEVESESRLRVGSPEAVPLSQ
jgi:hypothetical protein